MQESEAATNPAVWYVLGLLAYLAICGAAGCYVSATKGRLQGEGFWFGVLFGPLGLVVAACLPDLRPAAESAGPAPAPRPAPVVTPEQLAEAERRAAAGRAARQKQDAELREWARERAEADAQAKADAQARAEEKAEARERWYRERGIEPGLFAWFKALPELLQAAILGVGIAIPAIFIVVSLVRHS
jgi:hypothetical protein